MNLLLLVVILIAVFVVLVAFGVLSNSEPGSFLDSHPYYSKNPLTPTEATFYELLVQALPEHVVLAQVQLSRFIGVDRYKARGNFYRWFNPIAQQSVDYLICDRSFKVVAAIELDDKTHDNEDAIRRDDKKNGNIAAAGIRLLRWHAEQLPTTDEIQEKVLRVQPNEAGAEPKHEEAFNPIPAAAQLITLFANRPTPFTLFAAKAAMLLLFVGFMAWAISGLMDSASRLVAQAVPVVSANSARPVPVSGSTQQEQNRLQELQKQQAHLQQLQAEKARLDAMLLASREAAMREELWAWYYQKDSRCEANYDSDCANAYIRAKRKFDEQWNSGKRERSSFVR